MADRICIVTSGPVGSAPRVVKEADALAAAGYDTHVVATDITEGVRPLDQSVEARARWALHRVPRGPAVLWRARGLAHRVADPIRYMGVRHAVIDAFAAGRLTAELARRAASLRARLYIGHNVAGLVAAGLAARDVGAALGFDAEDDHVGELPDDARSERARRLSLMRPWIERCVHRTAASPDIASNCERRFDRPFTTILNVFPLADRAGLVAPVVSSPAEAYWFSQTVGPGRGLERALDLMARVPALASVHLRGYAQTRYAATLAARAERLGIDASRIVLLPTALPAEMTRLSARYAMGLSLEEPSTDNKRACLGNKVFQYLLGGVPVVLSNTPAQRALATELGDAALLLPDDAQRAVRQLSDWLGDVQQRQAAHTAAWRLAGERYNWERVSVVLLASVAAAVRSA